MMGNAYTCFKPDPDGPVEWFRANSNESLEWQRCPAGFGYERIKSYRDVACGSVKANRHGNHNGQLSGQLIFYEKALKTTNYAFLPREPTIALVPESVLYAKAFLNVPLHRIPVGQNNVVSSKQVEDTVQGHGATLLSGRPRMVALYAWVDDVTYAPEVFCKTSSAAAMTELEVAQDTSKSSEDDTNEETIGVILDKAMPGSFVTYMLTRTQDPFCFLHFPLLGSPHDAHLATGYYGETMVKAFCGLLDFAGPGQHTIRLAVHYWYDHCQYTYLPLGQGVNALGRWHSGLPNSRLSDPHPDPERLCTPGKPLAQGELTIIVPRKFTTKTYIKELEHVIPPEKYSATDGDNLRKTASTVAAGRFCEKFGLSGVPDWVILTSDVMTHQVIKASDDQTKASRELVHFAALWLNNENLRPDACGTMVEACMARYQVSPWQWSNDWIWILEPGRNPPRVPWPCPVANKFIRASKKGRRISVLGQGPGLLLHRLRASAWTPAKN